MISISPVILSGGSGSRLWPSSRSLYPKQFLKLVSDNTMLQETVFRLNGIDNVESPVVVANNEHRFFVADQLNKCGITPGQIILESAARNTAPAIALAALALEGDDETVMLVLPADHIVDDQTAFQRAVNVGRREAEKGRLVTFGVVPNSPNTGYGYIHAGDPLSDGVFLVNAFVEKPDLETAKGYLNSGTYSWNSGIFMFKPSVYLRELEASRPEIIDICRLALERADRDLDFVRIDAASFESCPSDSIDYAVMEDTENAVVIPIDVGWNDIGSWSALWEQLEKDEHGNVLKGDVIVDGVTDSLIISEKKLIAGVGVDNIVLVETDDSILLVDKSRVQDVKSIVSYLKSEGRPEAELHRKVYRPWGFYDSIENSQGFQVKRLVVYPGAELSLQMHHHRAEHWVVVKGTAEVVNGDQRMLLRVNESTYIPIGATHQLINPGKLNLELIEVQSGDYLGEDDIVRFEDIYGRVE